MALAAWLKQMWHDKKKMLLISDLKGGAIKLNSSNVMIRDKDVQVCNKSFIVGTNDWQIDFPPDYFCNFNCNSLRHV
jgi:predicted secreted protein